MSTGIPPSAVSTSIKIDQRRPHSGSIAAIQKVPKLFSSLILRHESAEPTGLLRLTPFPSASKQQWIFEYPVAETGAYWLEKAGQSEDCRSSEEMRSTTLREVGFELCLQRIIGCYGCLQLLRTRSMSSPTLWLQIILPYFRSLIFTDYTVHLYHNRKRRTLA